MGVSVGVGDTKSRVRVPVVVGDGPSRDLVAVSVGLRVPPDRVCVRELDGLNVTVPVPIAT